MGRSSNDALVAVDVGNTQIKWGLFRSGKLEKQTRLRPGDSALYAQQLQAWGLDARAVRWSVASVSGRLAAGLIAWLDRAGSRDLLVLERPDQLPLTVELDQPNRVGIDRLLNAVAVNERRPAGQSAVIIDCGSAITIDVVSRQGAFLGGSIAPGLALAAQALHHFTDRLPQVEVRSAPEVLGRDTESALQSGIFWGTVGAVQEIVTQMRQTAADTPVVYGTGGDMARLAPYLGLAIEVASELTLRGIYLAEQHERNRTARSP